MFNNSAALLLITRKIICIRRMFYSYRCIF